MNRRFLHILLLPLIYGTILNASVYSTPESDGSGFRVDFGSPSILPSSGIQYQTVDSVLVVREDFILVRSHEPQVAVRIDEQQSLSRRCMNVLPVKDVPLGLAGGTYEETQLYTTPVQQRLLGKYGNDFVILLTVQSAVPDGENSEIRLYDHVALTCEGSGVRTVTDPDMRQEILKNLTVSAHPALMGKPDREADRFLHEAGSNEKLKIWITKEGLYVLPHAMIEDAGFELSGIDPRYLRIYSREGEIPIRVVGSDDNSFDFTDYIEFYAEPVWDTEKSGEKRLHTFTDRNVYWLEIGNRLGLRMGQEDVHMINQSVRTSRSFMYLEHFEKDMYFNRLPYSDEATEADHWFYSPGIAGEEQRQLGFSLKQPDPFSTLMTRIQVQLRGQSQNFQYYPVEIYLNNHFVGQGQWLGNQELLIESDDFSPSYLDSTGNQLSVINKSDPDEFSTVFLDWFEIEYPCLYRPNHDYIRFKPPQYSLGKWAEFRIEGFTDPSISLYKKDSSYLLGSEIRKMTDTLGVTTYTVLFQDQIVDENTEYIAITSKQKLLPDSVMHVRFWDLRQQSGGADYIVIVPSDTMAGEILEPLLDLRESQGLRTMVVGLDTIYNEFNFGIPDVQAIHRFLGYAYHNWTIRPRFVLLVGDGYYNNRAGVENGNLLPSPLIQTYKYGAAPSDHYYTLLDSDDDLPDIAIGRIPVRTREDLSLVVDKIVNYENSPPDAWKNRYLLIGAGTTDDIFKQQSESIISQIMPGRYDPYRLYLSGKISDPYVGGTQDLLNMMNEGTALINFRGHGGGAIWADAGLLDLDDVDLIDNAETLPIITSMTCFTGDFSSNKTCLGEALLCNSKNGAIAFWGSTSVGWTVTDYEILIELYQLLVQCEYRTIGELIQYGKINFSLLHTGPIPRSELYQYTLIGDPATRIPFPETQMPFEIASRSLSAGDDIIISGNAPASGLQFSLDITRPDMAAIETREMNLGPGSWQTSLDIPQSVETGPHGVRLSAWDEETGYFAHGFQPFQVGEFFTDSLQTVPEFPSCDDSIRFTVWIESAQPLSAVHCILYSPYQDTLPMVSAGTHTYRTEPAVGPFPPLTKVEYAVLIQNLENNQVQTETNQYYLPQRPDFQVENVRFAGKDRVYLEADIRNLSDLSDSIWVKFTIPRISWTEYKRVLLNTQNITSIRVPAFPPMEQTDCIVTVNPDSGIQENNYSNNSKSVMLRSDRFNVTPGDGSILSPDQPYSEVGWTGQITCRVPSGAVADASVILFEDQNIYEIDAAGNEILDTRYFIDFPNIGGDSKLSKNMTLKIKVLIPDTVGLTRVYHRADEDRSWAVIPHERQDAVFVIRTRECGYFSLRNSQDTAPPEISLQIENQPYTQNCYVSNQPSISIILRDESGVDIRPGKIIIELNGQTQNESHFSIPDSLNDQRHVVVTYRPSLKAGDHGLLIMASDIHGNVQDPQLFRFSVSDNFQIRFLGNYPNPFKHETTFVYTLTNAASEASLKIFTVSGRLIRLFDHYELAAPDYHEVIWDGTDDFGNEVANGVYFFELKAKGLNEKQKVTGKIAKVR
ncbi:hypothetical protein JW948_05935 [bacterium]|nr:hypothetical protein [bacterium]